MFESIKKHMKLIFIIQYIQSSIQSTYKQYEVENHQPNSESCWLLDRERGRVVENWVEGKLESFHFTIMLYFLEKISINLELT